MQNFHEIVSRVNIKQDVCEKIKQQKGFMSLMCRGDGSTPTINSFDSSPGTVFRQFRVEVVNQCVNT